MGLLKCEKLPPFLFPFYATAVLSTAHYHLHDKPTGSVHMPLSPLTHDPKRITLLSSEMSIFPWPT